MRHVRPGAERWFLELRTEGALRERPAVMTRPDTEGAVAACAEFGPGLRPRQRVNTGIDERMLLLRSSTVSAERLLGCWRVEPAEQGVLRAHAVAR